MSWLLVAFIPGLLMLATFGLDRLEAGLDDDILSPSGVAAALEQAKADCAKPAARSGEEETYPLGDDDYGYGYRRPVVGDSARDLPIRVFTQQGSNPQFHETRHAFRV